VEKLTAGQHMHHWLFHQNEGIGRYVPDWLKNQPFNLMPMPSAAFHTALHGKGPNAMNFFARQWFGTPWWVKLLGGDYFGKGFNWWWHKRPSD